MIVDLYDYFVEGRYDKVIELGDSNIDSSCINNFYTLFSMIKVGDIFRALSFIQRSRIIRENLNYLEEGGANFKALADLANSDKMDLALLLFICNFINAIYKEKILNENGSDSLFIRMNEMIDDLYSAGSCQEFLEELTKYASLLY